MVVIVEVVEAGSRTSFADDAVEERLVRVLREHVPGASVLLTQGLVVALGVDDAD